MKRFLILLLPAILSILQVAGQETPKADSTKAKITMKGLFQARYAFSSHKDIDINGLQHANGKAIYNDFDIKRARLQFTSKISDRTDVVLLLNLADFKSDPANKVLENAYITYRLNPYLNAKMGQFRPAFGLEDMYPVDVIKSLDYSNQYTAFGSNGWQSFQIGASIYGAVPGAVPVKYELSVVNGNGRNQTMDNDNGKHFSSRVELGLIKSLKMNLGLNGGLATVQGSNVYATGVDLSMVLPVCKKWKMEIETEFKQGDNHALYYGLDSAKRVGGVSLYQMWGMYFLPNLRYSINYHRLSSLEFSCRYEYFDNNFRHASNPRQTYTPMIGAEFLKSYNARIQFGVNIDHYKKNIVGTTQYDNQLFVLQVQSRL
ncbi:Phosphate-selective porin O and P [Pedobacter westerhofensis]|uniref:Phosphate-selective porin O and P n=1 Tax=Pedobacter westerhofensis TaxID=425512 RepID=A0A521F4Y5_9SPHI|nr:porin [Pedobacter westerhofensis]SMO91222.1 Phosphate-selective porin O and P [Pedobacter westerhofensis]